MLIRLGCEYNHFGFLDLSCYVDCRRSLWSQEVLNLLSRAYIYLFNIASLKYI